MRPIKDINKIRYSFDKLISEEIGLEKSTLCKSKQRLEKLYDDSNTVQREAIQPFIDDFKGFLLQTPFEQNELLKFWNKLDSKLFYDPNQKGKRKTTVFGVAILNALKYLSFQKSYAATIVKETGIKACPYCNAMLTVVQRKTKTKKLHARCQLDHFFPKEKFPLLSISFFNLIPSCGQCNHAKSSNDVVLGKDFHLYAQETPTEGFLFKLSNISVANYLMSRNIEKLSIEFQPGIDGSVLINQNHEANFNITGLYETQKDVAEELLIKSQSYNPSRITELAHLMGLPEATVERMIIGTYTNKEDIHKRPMTKMIQDISRQLGMIK